LPSGSFFIRLLLEHDSWQRRGSAAPLRLLRAEHQESLHSASEIDLTSMYSSIP
jgi:hypothetical protein